MEARTRRRTVIFSWAGAATLLAALACANLLSYLLFARLDLSAHRAYSISRGTKQILRGLRDTLTIKVYYTPRLPPPYGLDRQYLRDLLAEYKSAGAGRVKVEFLDPDKEKVRREAVAAGVAPLQLSVMGRDKFEIKESFMGLVFLYRGKTEVMPVVQGMEDIEYDLTRRIKKLSEDKPKAVGFVVGRGEASPSQQAYAPVFELVREQMDLRLVSLDKPLPAELSALWIWGPKGGWKPEELERLKAWTASGRSLGLLISRRDVDYRSFLVRPVATGLEPLLSAWGVEPADGLVADAQAEKIQMTSAYGMFQAVSIVDYPFIPVATSMNRSHPAVRGLDAVSFPFVSPIKPEPRPGLTYTSLVDSSPHSWLRKDNSAAPGKPIEELAEGERGPFSLAGVLEGDFAKVTPTTAAAVEPSTAAAPGGPGRVVIVGTAKIAEAQFAGKHADLAFLMNLLDWSLQDEALLSIRAKAANYRPLRALPAVSVVMVKYALVLLPPFGLLAFGFWLYARRKAQRRLLARTYDA